MKSVPLITGGLSFLLSACSGGGGSFDVDDVSNPSSSKPRYQDDTSNQRTKSDLEKLFIPSLGGGMKLVAQNLLGKKEPSLLNEDGYIPYFSSLTMIKDDVQKKNTENTKPIGSIDEPQAPNSTKNHHGQQYVYSGLYYIESWRLRDPSKFYSGYYGYAYYFGKQTATTLPVDGVATYKGTWDFITATENRKSYPLFNSGFGAYNRRSATPGDVDLEVKNDDKREKGLVSEFSADFGNKKLTGKLFYTQRKTNNQEYKKEKLYDIDADIYSNRFRGKVIPKDKDPTSTDHPFTSEGTLEGGFYGPDGEELGGKFLAQDNRVFGVFSAKETEETPENKKLPRETLIDGKLTTFKTTDAKTDVKTNKITGTTANTKTNEKNFTTKDIPSFGEADYLLIDNYPIPLFPENTSDFATSKLHKVGDKTYQVEACCNNLSYVKFGMYYEDPLNGEKEKENGKEKQTKKPIDTYYQFLLGLRTPNAEIPTMGNVKYRGNWFGYISDGTTSYSPSGDKERNKNAPADFNVDFVNKKLTGELKRANTGNTVFRINATFQKGSNDFTGTATATNFVIDGNNSQNKNTQINITTDVKGAFYGPNATELGGYFTYNGNSTAANSSAVSSPSNSEKARAAVVFGAKKQQVETTK
ncbi:transferrin-binding protein-like solute binding protein [Haemophilus influenzae]|uniref:transferrin-binding protein-like solute binding protein n=1 Tax=Haemophilus influenzae TaxID=727 RepID=UPI000CF6802E|nr:transferrin-binding protein-like solute binding protein [Haemophilus influenzae]AVJ10538.1 transferrin binding protein-like solute binding family protein [Haemophilus influenzae]PRI93413.1 Transferrin-binding protein 2 precursor [Haemophilus influenzae]PRL13067.1 Transferrin-binding protein 2 precursor [Haemophilus influenzae]PRL63459.1 Transferrin-binding protein 2 precursor [Haemophilus influenzae]TWU86437.1 transferrin-binding protein-like solute binding protein [Haemophilus influenzae]